MWSNHDTTVCISKKKGVNTQNKMKPLNYVEIMIGCRRDCLPE